MCRYGRVVFSGAYGTSDGILISTSCYILLSCVDKKKKRKNSFILYRMLALKAATGGPIAAGKYFSTQKLSVTLLKAVSFELKTPVRSCSCHPTLSPFFSVRKDFRHLTLRKRRFFLSK